jgi:hypothetical protein
MRSRSSIGKAIDAALDLEQGVNAFDCLQRDRRDRSRILASPCIGGDVRQLEELSPGMGPAQRRRDRPLRARGIVQLVVAAIGIRLQDAAEGLQMPHGMFVPPVA